MTTVAITGVGGYIGRHLVAALERRDDVERVHGLDLDAPRGLKASKLAFRRADVRDADLTDTFRHADVVVHLAFALDPSHDERAMRAVNVDGSRRVFEAAARAGVRRLVYVSSVAAYGAHADNDLPLTEDSPLRGTPDFPYAEHKAQVEAWLWPWAQAHPELSLSVLRPAIVLGPGVDNFLTRLFESPRVTLVRGHKPPLQFVHVEDLVAALLHVIDRDLDGAYNVAAEGWLSMDEVTAIVGRRTVAVPEEVAISLAERLWRLGIGEQPPGMVAHLVHPWVASPAKLVGTGWRPRHSNRDALDEMVREHGPFVAVGGLRTQRRTVRSASLAAAGMVGVLATREVRRRQQHRRRLER
ncbi:NAD-dependent epimerase/dehydratase family protein [Egicoccus halophilus]|uniref:NAD-dependent dehydratase n=1 Tax=Egicoccus halophilus TaxID=1670830 RepID=A0A8J3ET39_9ACTN|nr:NAD-dependent epimerase/dehydratase family protein [Egicoccus halophilus]GGI08743.1 NAD-dependent dehydratase [Egicoccus halophilus]